MVAVFLRGELGSTRFEDAVGEALARADADARVVTSPDVSDLRENMLRRRLLTEARGYGTGEGVFGGLPTDLGWQRVALARDELADVRYIDWDYWVELSGGTRSPVDAARRIRAGVAAFDVPSEGFLDAAEHVGDPWPELILVTAGPGHPLVVLEGHVRLTAYVLAGPTAPDEVEALLGTSPAVSGWWAY